MMYGELIVSPATVVGVGSIYYPEIRVANVVRDLWYLSSARSFIVGDVQVTHDDAI